MFDQPNMILGIVFPEPNIPQAHLEQLPQAQIHTQNLGPELGSVYTPGI